MRARKKLNRNKRKGRATKRPQVLNHIFMGFKLLAGGGALVVVTVFFILVHDIITQCSYFRTEEIKITGIQRLSRQEVVRQAKINEGDNVLSVKLSRVRNRLLAHPWISDAAISREIPSRLNIRVKEHSALAAVALGGNMFLINHQGQIFKKYDPAEGFDIPVISGLRLSDLAVYDASKPHHIRRELNDSLPFRAVMQILDLGRRQGSILPNHLIRRIRVDRQIGVTVYAFDRLKAISFGYSDYIGKYHMLAKLLAYLKRQRNRFDFNRLDLNNLQRIVINPVGLASSSGRAGVEN